MLAEPRMDVQAVADAVAYMAGLPLDANVLFMTVMASEDAVRRTGIGYLPRSALTLFQPLHVAQLGNSFIHNSATAMVATPPRTAAGTVPEQGGGYAAFELAELVGGVDEQEIDGADATAHVVGGCELNQ